MVLCIIHLITLYGLLYFKKYFMAYPYYKSNTNFHPVYRLVLFICFNINFNIKHILMLKRNMWP